MLKRLLASALSAAMVLTAAPAVFAETESVDSAAAETAAAKFDPETTMWTDTTIDEVLARDGVYENAAKINPNADKKSNAKDRNGNDIQKPYEAKGKYFTGWAYSEYLWTHFYPIGNGRMAAMVAGGIDKDVIQINEDTCWDGSPYGELIDENGNKVTTVDGTTNAKTITTQNQTGGSNDGGWKYFRGANADGTPAEIGSADAIVGDEAFRTQFPDYANKSISNMALGVNNAKEQSAVQDRWNLHSLVEAKFLGTPTGQRAYKSFAEVYLDFGQSYKDAENYTKSLDMKTGIVTVEYDLGGKHYKRESFASYPDQTVATHVETDGELNMSAELHTYHEDVAKYTKVSDKEVKLTASVRNGNSNNGQPSRLNAITFEARMILEGDGAFSVSEDNKTVSVKGGKSATVYVVGATNYVDYLNLDNSKPGRDCDRYSANVQKRNYEQIKARHLADFTEQYSKSSLTIDNKEGYEYTDTPTEKRVRKDIGGNSGYLTGSDSNASKAAANGIKTTYDDGDYKLAVLEFNYGKYLLLSGARDGRAASGDDIEIQESQPLNLTGKWNAAMTAGWNGKYTININTEMNYWAAQPLNIGESEKTLIDTFKELAQSGSITADYQYGIGNCETYQPGDPWVMHHNFDLWRGTQPIDNATAGLWPTGGAWLLDHAWQYYKFNKDEAYLAEVYPYMVGAAKFFTQFLVVDPKTGYLITAASCSPEQGGVQPGPAMDTQLVRNLYDMVRQASEILGKTGENADLLAKIDEQMPSTYFASEKGKIAPDVVGNGGIQEWVRGDVTFDFTENDNPTAEKYKNIKNPFTGEEISIKEHSVGAGHRHCSHLWELFPGTHINPYSSDVNEQKIFKAFQGSTTAKDSADGKGWSLAWRMNLNARALQGDKTENMLKQLFLCRTAPNLFDEHPDFQIDGNYGATSGITEMVLQSHTGAIDVIPAIPSSWKNGSFEGFMTRENAEVSAAWQNGEITELSLKAVRDGDIRIREEKLGLGTIVDSAGNNVEFAFDPDTNIATIAGKAGETYTVTHFEKQIPKYLEGTNTVFANTATGFFASDNGAVPKVVDGNAVGYVNNRKDVEVGFCFKGVDLTGITNASLAISRYYDANPTVSVRLDKKDGVEIAKINVTETGSYALDLKNIDGITGKHDLYIVAKGEPYKEGQKYLCNIGDFVYDYKYLNPEYSGDTDPTTPPAPVSYDYEITNASYGADGTLGVSLSYNGTEASPKAKLMVGVYDESDEKIMLDSAVYDIEGTDVKNLDFKKPETGKVKLYVWDGTDTIEPKGAVYEVGTDVPASTPTAAPTAAPTNAPTTAPTANPTNAPTLAPTAKPTAAPTADPAAKGVYIGETKYNTISEAVAAAAAMNPKSEADRVYIDIAPGTYREQIVVKTPYITLRKKAGSEGDALLTWYYGLGSLYDSCNESGYYDPQAIGDGKSYGPKDWGPALKVDKTATGFTAENLILENSYNRYYTEEELTDITGVDPDTNNGNFHRVEWINEQKAAGKSDDEINAYLQSRDNITYKGVDGSPRERCAALHCSADKAVFLNCEIISTQDTIGINSGRMYFKNCKLGGTTDYICGSATAVFDNCELYVNAGGKGESATVTAPSNTKESEGYLFYNCYVTGSSVAQPGNMGRPWGAPPGPAAAYINTKIGNAAKGSSSDPYLISSSGWTDMSGNKPEEARFYEYGSVDDSGKAVDVSKRRGQLLDEWTMLRYNPYTFTKGSDDWDPAGVKSKYEGVDGVLASTNIDTSDGTKSEIDLPAAPSGYEFKWESDSEFATVNGNKLSLIRPANGEQPIDATVILYARTAADKSIGDKKSISFKIQPTSDTENVFTLNGNVTLNPASDNEQTVTIRVKKNNAVIKTVNVTVPANQTTASYTAENIPVGTYTVTASISDTAYNIDTLEAEITGAKGDTKTFDVSAKKMETITKTSTDFAGMDPTITAASGFSAGVYTANGSESANLGSGNVVYKLTKNEGATVKNNVGVSFDLKKLLGNGTLNNSKTIKFSYDFLMETTDYYPSDQSYFDLATSTDNKGQNIADQTRFARWAVMKGWGQINLFGPGNARINGDNTQFDKNNTMKNRWYTIEALIDLENKSITSTLYDRDKDMEILNKKPFTIAAAGSADYPTDVNLDNLYFNIYMDNKGNTANKMEYYFDNLTIEYQDFE